MMRMVCECVRLAPLSAAIDLKRRAALDAVRIGDDQSGTSPDYSGTNAAIAAA